MVVLWLSGFLFLFIIVLYLIIIPTFGYKAEINDFNAELQKIKENSKKFQIGIGLAYFHNCLVIMLTILLFIAFGSYNLVLGIVLLIFRIGEGLILCYNDKNYGKLTSKARNYSSMSDNEKISISNYAPKFIKRKSFTFDIAMIFWAIGTLSFSIILVFYGVVPLFIGWLGIIASVSFGIGDGFKIVKQKSNVLMSIAGLLAVIFEVLIGVWLLFFMG